MLGPDLAPLLPDYPHPGTSESHESHGGGREVAHRLLDRRGTTPPDRGEPSMTMVYTHKNGVIPFMNG